MEKEMQDLLARSNLVQLDPDKKYIFIVKYSRDVSMKVMTESRLKLQKMISEKRCSLNTKLMI